MVGRGGEAKGGLDTGMISHPYPRSLILKAFMACRDCVTQKED